MIAPHSLVRGHAEYKRLNKKRDRLVEGANVTLLQVGDQQAIEFRVLVREAQVPVIIIREQGLILTALKTNLKMPMH